MAATGTGPTRLAAFDAALRAAGVANFNLLYLSSVIPPGTEMVPCGARRPSLGGRWGDRLYVVMAQQREHERGRQAWAGIGWVQEATTSKGLLAEHEGQAEDQVRGDIHSTLTALCAGRPETFGPIECLVQGVTCATDPVCALVVAVFESAPWSTDPEHWVGGPAP